MGNFSYSNVRMRESLAIYTVAAEWLFTFGADSRFEHFQQNYVNPQFSQSLGLLLEGIASKFLKLKNFKLVVIPI